MDPDTSFVIACIQTHPVMLDVEGNRSRLTELVEQAVLAGARLVVLPECSTTGWCFESRDEARSVAEPVPDGPTCQAWLELCRRHDLHLVAGIVERDGDHVYNASVLLGPGGHLGTFRKVHLWALEKDVYDPGDLGFPVIDTPLGRIGMHICYDGWFSESYRLPALADADLLCVPANWVPVPTQTDTLPKMATMLCCTHAHMNLVYIAAASRVGVERGQPFIGSSVIVDHTGWPLAGPADGASETMITATIDPIGSRAARHGNPFNQPLLDRRTDVYRVEPAGAGPA